jgi:hypothetical protein
MRRIATAAIGILMILFYCTGCSSVWKADRHLRIAKRHIRKAEALGAKWSSDTLFKKLSFKVPGIDVKFTPRILTSGKPMIFTKDSVVTTVIVKPGLNGRDTVLVQTKCPDRIIYKTVPVVVNKQIKAGKSIWYYAGWAAMIAVVFFTFGYFTRAGPGKQLSIHFDKAEKPPHSGGFLF